MQTPPDYLQLRVTVRPHGSMRLYGPRNVPLVVAEMVASVTAEMKEDASMVRDPPRLDLFLYRDFVNTTSAPFGRGYPWFAFRFQPSGLSQVPEACKKRHFFSRRRFCFCSRGTPPPPILNPNFVAVRRINGHG